MPNISCAGSAKKESDKSSSSAEEDWDAEIEASMTQYGKSSSYGSMNIFKDCFK